MRWGNPQIYVLFAVLTFGPVGVRAFTWKAPTPQDYDIAMVQAGRELFLHEFTPGDSWCPEGDGLGPVFNAKSCVACHHQGGTGGGGGLQHNVTLFVNPVCGLDSQLKQGVIHAHAVSESYQETLANVDSNFKPLAQPTLEDLKTPIANPCTFSRVELSQRNTPALFGAKWIDQIPDQVIIAQERQQRLRWNLVSSQSNSAPVGRAMLLPDGRVGKFGWKGQTASLAEFVQAACANELGLGNPGQKQPTPLGLTSYASPGIDLSLHQCNQITAFVASLPRPEERLPDDPQTRDLAHQGKNIFTKIGCADCHTPNLGSVEGLYSDLLLHRMGDQLRGGGSYNLPQPQMPESPSDEWRTPPLWGVADSAPYLHDGRAPTLEDAIRLHAGQGASSARAFADLPQTQQAALLAFLKSLRAPVELN